MPSSLKILLVEDDRATNDTLVRLLRKAGHEVSAAKDGAAAGEMLGKERFDLVLSDIGLPDTNGWELIQRLRRQQPDLRAIALTGYGYPNDMKRSTQAGFEMHLTKPLEWPMVKAAIASLFPELKSAGPGTDGPASR
jgi:two-component system, chemotaxis family, CheB/CheR fusion protein